MKKLISMALALIMLCSLCSVFAFADNTEVYNGIYGLRDGKAFYCEDEHLELKLEMNGMGGAVVTFNGSTQNVVITETVTGFSFYLGSSLMVGSYNGDCIVLSGELDRHSYSFVLIGENYLAEAEWNPSDAAKAQGLSIPDDFVFVSKAGVFVTFYSTDRDNACRLKLRPESSIESTVGWLNYPFNAYLYGNINGWYLIRTVEDNFYYIPASVVGCEKIDNAPEAAVRGEGLIKLIEAQGVSVPLDFSFSDVKVGYVINETGSPYYALYKFKDPTRDAKEDSYGFLYYYCKADENTWKYDAKVTIYGYYGNCCLYQTKAGEFFWGHTSEYFRAA